tara:strand:+ start:1191 stop:1343 length:153 start_codon:yes stop_codon:yes gene_type:complete
MEPLEIAFKQEQARNEERFKTLFSKVNRIEIILLSVSGSAMALLLTIVLR